MNRKLMTVTAIMLALGLVVSGCLDTSGPAAPQVGNPAPDFQLQDLEGNTISLRDLRDSLVMLNFWASWCVYCVEEMPLIQEVYDNWQDRGLVILAINIKESLSTAKSFMEEHNLTFPALLDSDGSVSEKYDVRAIPTSFFIDKDGIIQDVKIGAFQSVADIENSLRKIEP